MRPQLTEPDTDGMAPTRSWAGYAGCAWALAYVPIHVYWALTGSAWPFNELPESLSDAQWRQANWGACAVIVGAAVVSLALVQHWGRRLPRPLLLGVAWVGAVFAVLHWVAFSAAILLNMIGVTDGAVTTFDRWNLFAFEPWFLGMGLLLAGAAAQNTRRLKQFDVARILSVPRSLGEIASAALILGGAVAVLVGVMTFHVWAYAVVGPCLFGIGMLIRVVARRSCSPVSR